LFEHDLSENRIPPVGSKPEGKLFRIMLYKTQSPVSRTAHRDGGEENRPTDEKAATSGRR